MKLSLKPIYGFFAPTDGFAEFIIVLSLIAGVVLAFLSRLTESYAAMLTALNIGAIAHDNLSSYFDIKRKDHDDRDAVQRP
jgi:hypothetical protein